MWQHDGYGLVVFRRKNHVDVCEGKVAVSAKMTNLLRLMELRRHGNNDPSQVRLISVAQWQLSKLGNRMMSGQPFCFLLNLRFTG